VKPRTLAFLVTAAVAAIAALAVIAAGAAPPPSSAPAPGFGETASVVSVEVPVTVVRGDEPVRGLTAADFALYDDGKPQKITGFEVVDLAAPAAAAPAAPGAAAPPPALPVAARRHFLFLFDLSFSEPAGLVKAQQAAKGLLRRSMHPYDLVAVATYSSAEGPRLVLGFSPDRRQAEYAIDTLGAPQLVDRSPDPLGLLYLTDKGETGGTKTADVGGKGADLALKYFQEISRVEVRAERQARRDVVTSMSRSLAELAKRMAGIEGKKYVVYLSQGFDSEFLLGTTDEETVRKNQAAAASGDRLQIDSDQRYGDTKLAGDVERMLEQFRRADCTIESVDIGGLQAGGDQQARHPGGKESLFTMARATGGDLVENTNDLGAGMGKLLARTSVTYLLSFQPEGLAADGRYRPLKVKLSNERLARGARVVARPGYYAPLPYLARSPVERRLAAAGAVLGAAGGRIATSVLATPLPVAGQAAYVPVVIEIDGPALLAGATTTAQADVFAYALDEQGTVHDHFAQALELDLAKIRGVLARGGVKLYGHFDLAPGRYLLRVLARNGLTGETGLATVPLTVPEFDRGEGALSPPLVSDAATAAGSATRWLNLREGGGREKLRDVPFPFVDGARPFLPAARPLVAAGADVPLLLLASGLSAGNQTLRGRVFAADGTPRPDPELTAPELAGTAPGLDRLRATFRPGSLPAGDYTLVITLTDPATRRQLSSSLPFAIAAAAAPGGR